MNGWSVRRYVGIIAIAGGLFALVGNLVAPRYDDEDIVIYRDIAGSSRYTAAWLLILVAVILVTAAIVGISRGVGTIRAAEAAYYGRLAAGIGGAMALLQAAVSLYAYKQQASAFADANAHNVVSAFWATNAVDHVNSAMFAIWTLTLLGIAPVLVGIAQLSERAVPSWLAGAAILGGLICVVVGVGSLLSSDQSAYDVPFLIGSLLVTLWIVATGVLLLRDSQPVTAPTAA